MYQLKPGCESFTVVDGPFAGRSYVPGRDYEDVPPQEKRRFREVKEDVAVFPGRIENVKTKTNKGAAFAAPENSEVK